MKPIPSRAWAILIVLLAIAAADQFQRLTLGAGFRSIQETFHTPISELFGVSSAFSVAFNAGCIIGGVAIWLAGVRWVMLAALVLSAAGALISSQATSAAGILPGRAVFGLGSAMIAIGAYRALAEWLPRHFHGTGVALFRGTFLALGVASSSVVLPLVQRTGWRIAFTAAAVWGILLAGFWVAAYAPRPGAGKVDTLREGELGLVSPVSWALIAGLVLIAPVQVLLYTWLPVQIRQNFGLSELMMQIPFVVSLIALLAAGLLSDLGIQLGVSAGRSRGVALIVAGLMMVAIALEGAATNPILAVVILSVAMAGYQAWSVILYSALLDAVPPGGVALVAGIAALLAAVMQTVTISGFNQVFRGGGYASAAIVLAVLPLVATALAALVWRIPAENAAEATTQWAPYSGYPPA